MIHIYEWYKKISDTWDSMHVPDTPVAWTEDNKIRLCTILESHMIHIVPNDEYCLWFNDMQQTLQIPQFKTANQFLIDLEPLSIQVINIFFKTIYSKFRCTYIGIDDEWGIILRFKLI